MSKKDVELELEAIDLSTLTKKELEKLELQINVQQKLIELEKDELNLSASQINYQSSVDKHRFGPRGISDGVLHLESDINDTVVGYITTKLDAFVHAHRDIAKKSKPGLTLIINSPGGSVFEGWRLFDELRAASLAGHRITTKVRGMAASMAAVLVQAGDERVIGPESYLMVHEPSSMAWGKAFEVKEQALLLERLNDQIAEKFASRSGKTKVEMKKLFERTDAWFNAEQCIKHGFADKIG